MEFWNFFSYQEETKKDNIKTLSKQQLVDLLTSSNCFNSSDFRMHEAHDIFTASKLILKNLDADGNEFDKELDAVVVGTYIIAYCTWQLKYPGYAAEYPLTMHDLCDEADVAIEAIIAYPFVFRKFIEAIGLKALNQDIPLNIEIIDRISKHPSLSDFTNLKQRLIQYLPPKQQSQEKEPIDGEEITSFCNIL